MKKYARLRASTSFTEQCEPCGSEPPEVPTGVNLDDDFGTSSALKSQSNISDCSTVLDGPAVPASSNVVRGEDVSKSASQRVLAEALKKLSSLKATQHADDPGLPRGVNSSHWVARSNFMIEVDAGSNGPPSNSSTSSAGKWPRRASQSVGPAELGGIHHSRTRSNAGVAAAAALGSVGITRTESCCTHTTHFTHRRSSSMHDIVLSQPATRLSPIATIHRDQRRGRAGKSGLFLVPKGFPDGEGSGCSPTQLLRCSNSCSAATAAAVAAAPPDRRLPTDPLQLSCHLWEEGSDAPPGTRRSAANATRATGVQSMRYDRWPAVASAGWTVGEGGGVGKLDQLSTWEGRVEMQSQSVREGAAQASAIAAMAQAYADKYGVAPAGVDLECMACGRGRGTDLILGSNSPSPGSSYNSSFCRSCRPPVVVPMQASASAAAVSSASTNSKKGGGAGGLSRGMMHYCRKLLLRMGKKPSHKYSLV